MGHDHFRRVVPTRGPSAETKLNFNKKFTSVQSTSSFSYQFSSKFQTSKKLHIKTKKIAHEDNKNSTHPQPQASSPWPMEGGEADSNP